jgi:competence protein ComEC
VLGPARVVQAASGRPLQSLREAIAARIMALLPGERGAIAATLLTGLGTAIPPDDRAAFAASGLAHLLAVAGLHIGVVMALLFGLARWSLAASEYASLHWPTRRIAAVAALAGGAGYLLLTGAHVPILRSFAMAAVVTLAVLTGRRAISLRALAAAALALIAVAPWDVMGVSFQMSFTSVLALVAAWEALRPGLARFAPGRWWRGPVLYGGGLALTSAVAGTASLPIAAYHFGNATLWYVPANMLAVPLTAFWVLPWGLVALLLMPFGAAWLALAPMGWGIGGLLVLARGVAAWPGAIAPMPQLPPQALLLMAAGLVWLCIWRTRLRLAGLACIAAGIALPFAVRAPDALVSADARVVASRIGGQVYVEVRGGASPFEAEAPGRVWGVAKALAFPAGAEGGAVACDAQACRWSIGARRVMLARSVDAACRGADMALAGFVLRGCGADVVIDRRAVAQDGATLLYGDHVVTDRDMRGDRPWVIRSGPALPAAKTE